MEFVYICVQLSMTLAYFGTTSKLGIYLGVGKDMMPLNTGTEADAEEVV